MNLKALREKAEALIAEQKALFAKPEMSDEDVTRASAISEEMKSITKKIELAKDAEDATAELKKFDDFMNKPVGNMVHEGGNAIEGLKSASSPAAVEVKRVVPAEHQTGIALKTFTRENGFDESRADREYKAFRFGQFMVSVLQQKNGYNNTKNQRWLKEHGIPFGWHDDEVKAQVEGINTAGGFLVPEELERDLIVLREMYGVMRDAMRVVRMASDTKRVPRQTGNLTTYFNDEVTPITESQVSLDAVQLVAKKLTALATWSTEVAEDAIIDIGDKLAYEIGYAFSKTEDNCAVNGDGTSTYGGIQGFRQKIINLTSTIGNIAGAVVQTGTGAFSTVLTDYQKVVARLPQYADTPNACFLCHRTFWASVMQVAELAAGGVTSTEVIQGVRNYHFLGYPVKITQQMPSTYVANDIPLLFGDFGLAAKFGDRRQMTIAMSEHANFRQDQLVIRGTERFDIVVHDVGNQSATAGLRVPGPVVALFTGTS